MIRSCRKPEAPDSHLEQSIRFVPKSTKPAELTGRHVGVGKETRTARKPGELAPAGPVHPLSNHAACFAAPLARELAMGNRRHLYVDIDPVEERPGES